MPVSTTAWPMISWRAPVAVVGAGGFIGSRLVEALTAAGVPVAAFTRSRPFCDSTGRPAPGLRAARTIFHLATSVNMGLAEHYPDRVAADHQLFLRLLDATQRCEDCPTVVLASSGGAVYDSAVRPPYRENSPVRPSTAYGRAKIRLEQQLLRRIGRVKPFIVRLSNPYGPGQPLRPGQGVLRHWLRAAAAGEPLRVFGDSRAIRDYVYIDDVIDALIRLTSSHDCSTPARILNIGSGEPTSLAQLLGAVRDCLADPDVVVQYVLGRSFDRRDTWLDVRAAEATLGWRPTTPLAEGIRQMWAGELALAHWKTGAPRDLVP